MPSQQMARVGSTSTLRQSPRIMISQAHRYGIMDQASEAITADAAQAMLYAAGVPDRDAMKNSPHVGVASVWWEGNPCNMHCKITITIWMEERYLTEVANIVLDLGKTVKEAVTKQGMLAWQYNTIGVSDAITMGNEGISRLRHRARRPIDRARYALLATNSRNHSR